MTSRQVLDAPRVPLPEAPPAERSVSRRLPRRTLFAALRLVPLLLPPIALVAVVVYPIVGAIIDTYVQDGHVTLAPFRSLFDDPTFGDVVKNTVIYALGTLALATVMGIFLAWAVERTDARIRWFAGVLPILPLVVPPIGSVIGYTLLLSPRSGLANRGLRALLGMHGEGPINVNSMLGLIIVSSINMVPSCYLVLSAAFRQLDGSLDEASRVCGAGPGRTALRVTLPAIRPALASAALIVGIMTIGMFAFPMIIGTGARITVASVFIFRQFSNYPGNPGAAISFGLLVLVLVEGAVLVQNRLLRASRHALVAGKQGGGQRLRLGVWKWPVRVLMIAYLLAVVAPVVGLLIGSLQPFIGAPLSLHTLGFEQFHTVLGDSVVTRAVTNSVVLGLIAAGVAMCLASGFAFSARGARGFLGLLPMRLAFLPSAIPHVVLASAFLIAFSREPFSLYGTKTLLVIAYAVMYMPQAVSAASAAVSQVSPELSEASRVSGAGPLRTAVRVVLPQVAAGLLAGVIIVFSLSTHEVTASSLLAGVGNPVSGQVAVDYYSTGLFSEVAVLALIMVVIAAVVVTAAFGIVRRSYTRGSGSSA
ncbi:MAG TPA: iron ABC transporter permease [Rugosimonospora sp.]|nr:iron ABC transporter permease [Rugosimonospora sp.]